MIAFVMAAALGAGGGGGGAAAPWETPAWAAFRSAWDAATSSVELAAVDAERARLDALERGLLGLLPEKLARGLAESLKHDLDRRIRVLTPRRGKPPRPDRPAGLREDMAELERENGALRELRALGWKDPWLEDRFAAHVALVAATVEDAATVLEEQEPKQRKLVAEARALTARVRPGLPPPRPPP